MNTSFRCHSNVLFVRMWSGERATYSGLNVLEVYDHGGNLRDLLCKISSSKPEKPKVDVWSIKLSALIF